MKSKSKKAGRLRFPYQVLPVLLAFALMVFLSYAYLSGIERGHLRNDAYNILSLAQKDIESDLKEQEMTMGSLVRSVLRVIRDGGGLEGAAEYLEDVTAYLFSEDEHISGFSGVYGYFDIFGGVYIHGKGNVSVPEGFAARQPGYGYTEAVEAGGKTVMMVKSDSAGKTTITYSCQLLNTRKEQIGVIAFDVPFDRIVYFVTEMRLTEGGYGFLVDDEHKIIAHPSADWIGVYVSDVDSGAEVKRDMGQGKDFFEYEIGNVHYSKAEPSVLSYKRISNGWYLGMITPRDKYYVSMYTMMWILILLGAIMAVLLSAILLRISAAKKKADAKLRQVDEYARIFFDATPTSCTMWDRDYKMINCNQSAFTLFGVKDREEFNERFIELSPEHQPNGGRSDELMTQWLKQAFDEGFLRVEWVHRLLSGELMPCEVTCVRVKHGDDELLAVYTKDLREIKAAKDELDETKYLSEYEIMKYKLTNNALGISVWDMDIDASDPLNPVNYFTWSQEFRHMLGFTDENDFPNLLHSFTDRLHPEDLDKTNAAFAAHINDYTGKTPYDVEYRCILKNGECRWFRAFGDTLRDSNGIPIRVAGATMDITEKKQMEDALQKALQISEYENMKYKLTSDALHLALWDMNIIIADPINPVNHFTWSQEFRQMLGFDSAEEFPDVLHSWSDRLHSEDKERTINAFAAHINDRTGKITYDEEYRLLLKNGQYRWFRAFGVTQRDQAGMPLRVVGAFMDIHDTKKARDDIEYRDKLLSAGNSAIAMLLDTNTEAFEAKLYKSMQIIAEAVDVHRVCIWKNHLKEGRWYCILLQEWVSERRPPVSGEFATDVSYDDVLHGWYEVLSQEKCLASHVGKMSPDEQAQLEPQKIQSLFVAPVFIKEEFWGYVGYDDCLKARDFTGNEQMVLRSTGRLIGNAFLRNEMERETLDALESARQASRAKSEFLSHISHEIRTPMNAILGTSEIQLQNESYSPETEEAFGVIYQSGNLLLNIINDMLDHSKIEAGRLELMPVKYDIPSLIHDTMQLNILRYDSKPIEFILNLDENTPLDLFGDELRIKQILNNIFSNAFKYTDSGKVEFSVSAETAASSPPASPGARQQIILILRVSDTGQGMTGAQIDRLFDEYARFNMNTNRATVGTGLGMSITKRLIEMMNGEIFVESEIGKGSIFTVRLPQERIGTAVCGKNLAETMRQSRFQSISRTKKAQILHEYMPYGRVLIVDDVESNLYVAKGMMTAYGLKIETAASGIEALEKIKNGGVYDVIFMDHMMPQMDGMEATKILRDMGYTKTIVALTANAVAGMAEIFLANGFDAFISKPIDTRELNAVLNHRIRDQYPPEIVEAARLEKGRKKTDSSPVQTSQIKEGLLKAVAKDVKNAISVLEDVFAKINTPGGADILLYTTTVHGLKSALKNINETELSDFAFKLEKAGKNEDLKLISAETPDYINMLRELLERIKPAVRTGADGVGETAGISREDTVFLRKKLLEIKTACEKLNVKTAKAALADLKQPAWPRGISDVLDEISMNLIRAELKKVVSFAEDAIGRYAGGNT